MTFMFIVLAAACGWVAKIRCLIHTDLAVHVLFSPKYFSTAFSNGGCLLNFLWSKSGNKKKGYIEIFVV
jgi:hypothetical protein